MNILYAGTPEPSAKLLRSLVKNNNINIVGVISKPDIAKNRGKKIHQSQVSFAATEANLPIYKPDNLNSLEFKQTLLKLDFDFLIVAAYGKILPDWMLESPKIMSVNVHYSLLPKYRGASPIQSCLLNGDKKTGITFIKMSNDLDEGDCIQKYEIEVHPDHNKITLEDALCNLAKENIYNVLSDITQKNFTLLKQNNNESSYCKKINKKDSMINFTMSSSEIYNKFRAFYEWPGISFEHKGTTIKIKEMYVIGDNNFNTYNKIFNFTNLGLIIKTMDKNIVITHLQFPNKNIITSKDASNAYKEFFDV
jgi:methionyl-tRNA formyltransferase